MRGNLVCMETSQHRYHLLSEVSRSHRTVVWRAADTSVGEEHAHLVALKVDRTSNQFGSLSLDQLQSAILGPTAVGCLRAHEARVLQLLNGMSGIPRCESHGYIGVRAFVAVRWIDGVPLVRWLEGQDDRTARFVEVAARLCRVLAAVGRLGIVHRDLKPSNILVTALGEPVVIDWELAQLPSRRPWGVVGTRAFLAPELLGLRERMDIVVDQRADLYALGATLYAVAAGRPPIGEGREAARRSFIEPLARMPAWVPDHVVRIITMLLAADPSQRPRDADLLATMLIAGDVPDRQAPTRHQGGLRTALESLESGDLVAGHALLENAGPQPDVLLVPAWSRFLGTLGALDEASILLLALPHDRLGELEVRLALSATLRAMNRADEARWLLATDEFDPRVEAERARVDLASGSARMAFTRATKLFQLAPERARTLVVEQLFTLVDGVRAGGMQPEMLETLAIAAMKLALAFVADPTRRLLLAQMTIDAVVALAWGGHFTGHLAGAAFLVALAEVGAGEHVPRASAELFGRGGFVLSRSAIHLGEGDLVTASTGYFLALLELGAFELAWEQVILPIESSGSYPSINNWLDVARVAAITRRSDIIPGGLARIPLFIRNLPEFQALVRAHEGRLQSDSGT